jgi:putative transposase
LADEEVEVAFALQQAEGGTPVAEVCRKMGISEATFYRWKQLYGGLMPSEVKKLRQLEEENVRLRKVVADLTQLAQNRGSGLGKSMP